MQQYQSIHYLRGAAALMVVVMHIHTGIAFMRPGAAELSWLRGGVDLFFVISGFVMVKSTDGKAVTPQEFFIRRCQRIMPLYWLATLVMMTSIEGEFLFKLGSMFFIPMANPESGALEPVVEPGWTLNYEMFFYLLFAMSLTLPARWRFAILTALLTGLAALSPLTSKGSLASFYTNPVVLEFLMGMAIAKFNLRGPALLVPMGFVLMYLLYPWAGHRVVSLGLPAAMIVAGAVGSESRLKHYRLPKLLGDASYSIYIFHLLALGVFVKYWPKFGLDNIYFFAPPALAFVICFALAVHWLLERPIIAWFARQNAASDSRSASTAFSIFKRQASSAAFKNE